ncbi:hypothetical protein PBI_JOHANN_26 [Microbacterium phage Johann]|uniref:Uncharacterized protein n=2 Tax=Goodmanvirus goodman TaxID=2734238 RepID=A0A3G3LZW4_9CAUD|nr:hypothetical protein HOU56_gp26 [Microbacterium phage Goodman]AYQ99482.1 hypothetical protein PBI_GOODMAN_26 [Microbacterium phage Goodman]AYQ99650.1 hypothetical protein PBI_JOHANN_26 [Microbacterium phage Johann]
MSNRNFSYMVRAVSPSGNSGQDLIVRAPNKDDALQGFHDATEGKMTEWTITVDRLTVPTLEAKKP